MKVRELTNLVSSCDVRRILAAIRGKYIGEDDAPGKDTGLPVLGECTVSPFPLYFGQESAEDGYRITVTQQVAGVVKDALPGGAKRLSKWYCIDSTLAGYRTIPADKVPKLCRTVGYLGGFAVMVDLMTPGADNEVPDKVYDLLADMVLRFDNKGVVREEAIKLGCKYINGTSSMADLPHIALAPRMDMAIEYDFNVGNWRRVQNIAEISSLHNKTQHRDFVAICQPGKVSLTGEQVAKLVLSTQEAVNTLGQMYLDNLDELLGVTRFKVLHPLDTKGYFLRMSASTIATASAKAIYAPAISHFPVWLHDLTTDCYYQLNLGLAMVDPSTLPEHKQVAGKLGQYCEVIYDTDAQDMYYTEQLAYLAVTIMKSRYPDKSAEGAIAMYGCMEHLNSMFAPMLMGKGIDCLLEVPGTRIENLDPDPSAPTCYYSALGLSTSCAKVLQYDTYSDTIMQVAETMVDREHALTGECSYGTVKSIIIGKSLVRFAEAKPFETWEAGLQSRMELELEDVPAAYTEYFSKAPHVKDPIRVNVPGWAVLKVGENTYTLTEDLQWAELVGFKSIDSFLHMGQFFCGELYCRQQDVKMSSESLTKIITSTAQYFVDFEAAPTVFKYLYNMDSESGRWNVTGIDQSANCIMFGNADGTLSYDPTTRLWAFSNMQLDDYMQLGPVWCFVSDDLKAALTVENLSNACLALSLCLSGLRGSEAKPVPAVLGRQRAVPFATDKASWAITINGQSYTEMDGDWALYTGPYLSDGQGTCVRENVFFSLLLNYICYFTKFQAKDEKPYALFSALLGGALEETVYKKVDCELTGYMWIDRNSPMSLGPSATWSSNPGFLPMKSTGASNLMGISYYLDSDLGFIAVEDFAQMLSCLNSVSELFNKKCMDAPSTPQEVEQAFRSFVDHQSALCSAYEEEVKGHKVEAPILCVGRYGWDGDNWGICSMPVDAGAGSLWGNNISYASAFAGMPISVTQAVTELYHLTTLLWEPDRKWFPILETLRKR